MKPVTKGFMYGLNSGSYSAGRILKKLGFDITLVAN